MYRFTREVQIHGQTYTARVEVQFSSATKSPKKSGEASSEQQQRTQFMQNYFVNALQILMRFFI